MTTRAKYNFLSMAKVSEWVPIMAAKGVSKVARGKGGFIEAYRLAKGDPSKLPVSWIKKRDGFIARHLANLRLESKFDGKLPTRRHLALIAWAYSPTPSKI